MNIIRSRFLFVLMIVALMSAAISCNDDEPALPPNLVSVSATELGIADTDSEISIAINVSRVTSADKAVSITFVPEGVTYGEEFTTEPAAVEGAITVIIPQGETSASLVVKKTAGIVLDGDESVVFTVQSIEEPFVLTEPIAITLTFAQIISQGSTLTLAGRSTDAAYTPAGGINYANTVYADLSANNQLPVDRKSWNLAFYSGSEFKVVLNPNAQTTAAALAKTDITTVTLEDAETIMNLNHNPSDPATLALVDYYSGALDRLVFATVSATESENKVYLVSFEGNKEKNQWYKVKVNRNGDGYKIQYALIGETTIKTLDVPKSSDYNFGFVSLVTNNIVSVEPRKTSWDISWGYSTYMSVATDVNSAPYWYQDFVAINHLAGAKAAEVIKASATEAEAAFTSFSEVDIAGVTFLQTRDAIGSKWRVTLGSGIKKDRFYVVQDAEGNIYKLRFITMGVGDTGERGRPVIEYKLVKKAV